jgi:2-polyprenyl-6-hydroxyphenyl methylase/3-demethylubiquinone-9 3-methyltransferase
MDIVVCVDLLEHVEDVERVIAEIGRVLKPRGLFSSTRSTETGSLSAMMITIAENILGLLPRGTHDRGRFITPAELRRNLADAGFILNRFAGFGPHGLNRHLDPTFGLLPTLAIQYMGEARLPDCQNFRAGKSR